MKASFTAAATLAVAAAFVSTARADDVGPARAVAAVRDAAGVLLNHCIRERYATTAPVTIEAVAVRGSDATVSWQSGTLRGTQPFHWRSDRWWLLCRDDASATGGADPYDATFAIGAPDPMPSEAVPILHGRAPTEGEMPPTPGMNAYYFFTLTTGGSQTRTVRGATLDVWFPFVLDPRERYVLWLGFVEPEIRAIQGTLSANVLHFDLPDFTLSAQKAALGEIDGDIER